MSQLRSELKYTLGYQHYELLRNRVAAVMKSDLNTVDKSYNVCSLYFDDIYRSAYSDKIIGVSNRRKFRIRAYNKSPDFIKFEEKCKSNEYNAKKAMRLTFEEYEKMRIGDYHFLYEQRFEDTVGEDFLLANSIFHKSPFILIDYDREPFVCEDGNVRITFDRNISAAVERENLDIFGCSPLKRVCDYVVLEIKFDSFLPMYIKQIFEDMPLIRESVSKYALSCQALCYF